MAKPKNPRIGTKPKSCSTYMIETIDRSHPDVEKVSYNYFQVNSQAVKAYKEKPSGSGVYVRLFRIDHKMMRDK